MPAPDAAAPLPAPRSPGRALLVAATLLLAIGLGLALYGLGSGGRFYFKLAQAPLAPTPAGPYYRESLLHVGLAHMLGLTGSIAWFRFYDLAFFWAALASLAVLTQRRLAATPTALVLAVALTHPAAMIVHAWTCHPDALLLLLALWLLFARRPAWVAALAALLAWTNLAMALCVALATALLWFGFSDTRPRARSLALLLGLGLGASSLKLTLLLAGVHIARDRFAAAAQLDLATVRHFWTDPGWPIVYTLYFAHLVWLPALLATLYRQRPVAAVTLLATQMLALSASLLAEDTTRVFACLAFTPLLYALIHALAGLARPGATDRYLLRPLVALGVLLSLVGPKFFAWKGALHDLTGAHAYLRSLLP